MVTAFVGKDFQVDVCRNQLAFSGERFCFTKERTVFANQAMTAENSILCGFADACGSVYIGCQTAGRLLSNQLMTILGFACQFVAGRSVQQQCSAVKALVRAGRDGYPQVFTDFHTDFQKRNAVGAKSRSAANGKPSDLHRRFPH